MFNLLDPQSRLSRRIEKARVVSFDVFDTAIRRSIDEPRSVFRVMESRIVGILGSKSPDFPSVRYLAEGEARRRGWLQGNMETTLPTIYAAVGEILGLEAEAI